MKILSGLTLFLLLSMNVYSQPVKIKFGIKAGLALAKSKIDYADNSLFASAKMKIGLSGGGFVNIYLKNNLIFQPAAQYINKGLKENSGNDYYFRRSFNYVEIPLNVLFKSLNNKRHYYLGTGLSPAFHTNRYYSVSEVKKFDLGVNLLAGYMFPIGFSINLGYTHGILNVSGDKNYASKIQNRYFGLTAGYEF